tara:strand:- start:718 stop:825 length:108 start_codon:yes stop_codon:yes gene_type:complete
MAGFFVERCEGSDSELDSGDLYADESPLMGAIQER